MVCSRCGGESEVTTRGDPFCRSCYERFLDLKFHRSMERFTVDYTDANKKPPMVIVAVSLRTSSLVLVSMLGDQLRRQSSRNRGRKGFSALCVHVGELPPDFHWPFDDSDLPLRVLPEPEIASDLSRSSYQDLRRCMLRQVMTKVAIDTHAEAVLWGHSTTKLSELVLSETVKGRGAEIPEFIGADAEHSRNVFPLRLVTKDEIDEYARGKSIVSLVPPLPAAPGVRKLQSIDEIVHAYFSEVNKNFPAVVSTVSRVASKLAQEPEPCSICLPESVTDLSTDRDGPHSQRLCYGCRVMLMNREGKEVYPRASIESVQQIVSQFEL